MPCAPTLLVALLPLWIQATSASAQLQFSDGWSHGKRSEPALRPSPLVSLLGALAADGDSTGGGGGREQPRAAPPSATEQTAADRDTSCPIDESVIRLVYETIMREADRVSVCRIKSGLYGVYMTT